MTKKVSSRNPPISRIRVDLRNIPGRTIYDPVGNPNAPNTPFYPYLTADVLPVASSNRRERAPTQTTSSSFAETAIAIPQAPEPPKRPLPPHPEGALAPTTSMPLDSSTIPNLAPPSEEEKRREKAIEDDFLSLFPQLLPPDARLYDEDDKENSPVVRRTQK